MEWFFILGMATGMRAMTPMAVVCWFCWLRMFPVQGTWAFWAGNIISAVVFTLLALGEYFGDTQPRTPNRTAAGPAISRLIFGGLVGAVASTASLGPIAGGVLFGVIGAAVGTWGGFHVRRFLTRKLGNDLPVALFGSAMALALSILAAYMHAAGIRHMDTLIRLNA